MVIHTAYTIVKIGKPTDIARNTAVEEIFVANFDVVDCKRIWITQRSSNATPR